MLWFLAVLGTASAADSVPFEDLVQENGIVHQKGSTEPFTGLATRTFPDGRKTATHFVDGKGNGLSTIWHANGQKARELTLVDDLPHGTLIEWDAQGNETARTAYDHGEKVEKKQSGAKPL